MSFNHRSFWHSRPQSISKESWLFHPLNRQRLPECAREVLRLIKALAKPQTWFHQSWLAEKVSRSVRWVREILGRLEKIGVILVERGPFQNYYSPAAGMDSPGKSGSSSAHEDLNKKNQNNINLPEWIIEKWREKTGGRGSIWAWWVGVRELYVGG